MTVTRRKCSKVGALTYTLLDGYLIFEGLDAGAFHFVVFRICNTRYERMGSQSRALTDMETYAELLYEIM